MGERICVHGVSGSRKSSIVFDTIAAECLKYAVEGVKPSSEQLENLNRSLEKSPISKQLLSLV